MVSAGKETNEPVSHQISHLLYGMCSQGQTWSGHGTCTCPFQESVNKEMMNWFSCISFDRGKGITRKNGKAKLLLFYIRKGLGQVVWCSLIQKPVSHFCRRQKSENCTENNKQLTSLSPHKANNIQILKSSPRTEWLYLSTRKYTRKEKVLLPRDSSYIRYCSNRIHKMWQTAKGYNRILTIGPFFKACSLANLHACLTANASIRSTCSSKRIHSINQSISE